NADILAVHLPHVVQSSVADGDAAHEYRLQARHRRDRARASHLELDVTYYRQRFLCGKFVGDRPTRSTRHKTELPLVVEPVDLVDDAVDVVAQLVATLANLPVIGETSIDALDDLPFRADLKAPQLQLIQYVAVAVRQLAMLDQPYRIHVNVQRASGSKARVELPQASCRSVPRIDKRFLTFPPGMLIKLEKAVARHKYLAPNLQKAWIVLAVQSQWHSVYRSQVVGDVLASRPVAPRC